jgi:hypothetical protein
MALLLVEWSRQNGEGVYIMRFRTLSSPNVWVGGANAHSCAVLNGKGHLGIFIPKYKVDIIGVCAASSHGMVLYCILEVCLKKFGIYCEDVFALRTFTVASLCVPAP